MAAATDTGIKVWDLVAVDTKPLTELKQEVITESKKNPGAKQKRAIGCTSLAWNTLGKILYGGFQDGVVRVWEVNNDKC